MKDWKEEDEDDAGGLLEIGAGFTSVYSALFKACLIMSPAYAPPSADCCGSLDLSAASAEGLPLGGDRERGGLRLLLLLLRRFVDEYLPSLL